MARKSDRRAMRVVPDLTNRVVVVHADPREHVARYGVDTTLCGKEVLTEIHLRGRLAPCPDCRDKAQRRDEQ